MNIILTGMMGTGKTTVGKKLAEKLNLEFTDLDEYIEKKTRLNIPQIFSAYGELHFRKQENKLFQDLMRKKNLVISTGGKTLLNQKNIDTCCTSGIIITLFCNPETIIQRIQKEEKSRPLLSSYPAKRIYEIYRERKALYLNLPNKIDTTCLNQTEVVDEIIRLLKGKEMRFDLNREEWKSSLIVKNGLRENFSTYLKKISRPDKAFILSDEKVFSCYSSSLLDELKKAKLKYSLFLLSPGERHKNLKSVRKIYQWLLGEKASRFSLFISFGGGVITDIGGYAASTFYRGVQLVNIPTTLLSQIDAAIGGKNGVNLEEWKNQVGTFYFPSLVLIDPLFLVSLNPGQMKEGLVEALKAALIADKKLFHIIKKNPRSLLLKDIKLLEEVIKRAIKVKLDIVKKDPLEKKERKLLNLGHTFGHALESYFNYQKISHGEAVGLGMICAARMGALLNLSSENLLRDIKETLLSLESPICLKNLDISRITSLMEYDKKRKEDRLSFIVPREVGDVVIQNNARKKIILDSLKEISVEEKNFSH